MGNKIRFKEIIFNTIDENGNTIYIPLTIDADLIPNEIAEENLIESIKFLPDFLQNTELMVDATNLLDFTLNNSQYDILKDIHTAFCDIKYKASSYVQLSTEAKLEVLKEKGYNYMVELLTHMYDIEYNESTKSKDLITKEKEESISKLLMLFNTLYCLKGTTVGLELALLLCNVNNASYITWDTIARKRGILNISKKHDTSDGVSYEGTDKDDIKCEYMYTLKENGFDFDADILSTYGYYIDTNEDEQGDENTNTAVLDLLYKISNDMRYSVTTCLYKSNAFGNEDRSVVNTDNNGVKSYGMVRNCEHCPCKECIKSNCEGCSIIRPYEMYATRYFTPDAMSNLSNFVPSSQISLPFKDSSGKVVAYKPLKGDYWEVQQNGVHAYFIIFNGSSFNILNMQEETLRGRFGKERERFTADLSLGVQADREDSTVIDLYEKIVEFVKQYMLPWINIRIDGLDGKAPTIYCYPSGSHLLKKGSFHKNYYVDTEHIRENLYHALSNETEVRSRNYLSDIILGAPEYEGNGFTGTINLKESYVENDNGDRHYLYTNEIIVPDFITGTAVGEREITDNTITIKDFFKSSNRINNIIALNDRYQQETYSIFLEAEIIVDEPFNYQDYYFKLEDESWHSNKETTGHGVTVTPSELIELYNDNVEDDWVIGTDGDDEIEIDVEKGKVVGGTGCDQIVKRNGKLIYYFAEKNFGKDVISGATKDDWIKFCNSKYDFVGYKFSSLTFRKNEDDLLIIAPTYVEEGLPANSKIDKNTGKINSFDETYIGTELSNGNVTMDISTGKETYDGAIITDDYDENGNPIIIYEPKDQYIISKIHSNNGYKDKESGIFGPTIYNDIILEPGRKTRVELLKKHPNLEFDFSTPKARESVGTEICDLVFNGTQYDGNAQNIINDIGILGANKYFIYNQQLFCNYTYIDNGEERYDFRQVGTLKGWSDVGASSPIDDIYLTPAICNGNLYSIENEEVTLVSDDKNWTAVTGYCRYLHTAFAIADGNLYGLKMETRIIPPEVEDIEDLDDEEVVGKEVHEITYFLIDKPVEVKDWEDDVILIRGEINTLETEKQSLENKLVKTEDTYDRINEISVELEELQLELLSKLESQPIGWEYIIGVDYDTTYEGFGIKNSKLYRLTANDFSNETNEVKLTERTEIPLEVSMNTDNNIVFNYLNIFEEDETVEIPSNLLTDSDKLIYFNTDVFTLTNSERQISYQTEEETVYNVTYTFEKEDTDKSIVLRYINNVLQHLHIKANGCEVQIDIEFGKITGTIQELDTIFGWDCTSNDKLSKYLHKNNNYYSYGICEGRLYYFNNQKVGYIKENDTYSAGWTSVCGYYNKKSPRTFGYGIKDSNLYEIKGDEVVLRDSSIDWIKVSGCAYNSKTFVLAIGTETVDNTQRTYVYGINASTIRKMSNISGWNDIFGRVSYMKEDIDIVYGYGVTSLGQVVAFNKGGDISTNDSEEESFGGSLINGCWTFNGQKITLHDYNIENLTYYPHKLIGTDVEGNPIYIPKTDNEGNQIVIDGEENIRNYILQNNDEYEDFDEFNFKLSFTTTGFDSNKRYQIEAKVTDSQYEYLYPDNKPGLYLNDCTFNSTNGCVEDFASVHTRNSGHVTVEGNGDMVYDVASYMMLPLETHSISTRTEDDYIVREYTVIPNNVILTLTLNDFTDESNNLKPIITDEDGINGLYYGTYNNIFGIYKKYNNIYLIKECEINEKVTIHITKDDFYRYEVTINDTTNILDDFCPYFIGREKINEKSSNLSSATFHLGECYISVPTFTGKPVEDEPAVNKIYQLTNNDIIVLTEINTSNNSIKGTSIITNNNYNEGIFLVNILREIEVGEETKPLYESGKYITIETDYYNTSIRLKNDGYQTTQKVVDINNGLVELKQDEIYSSMTTSLVGLYGEPDFSITRNDYNYNQLRYGVQEGSSYAELIYDGEYLLDTTKVIEHGDIKNTNNYDSTGIVTNFNKEDNLEINIKNLKDPLVLDFKSSIDENESELFNIYRDDEFTIYNKDNKLINSNIYDIIELSDRKIGLFPVSISEAEPQEEEEPSTISLVMPKYRDGYPNETYPISMDVEDYYNGYKCELDFGNNTEYIKAYYGTIADDPYDDKVKPDINPDLPIINNEQENNDYGLEIVDLVVPNTQSSNLLFEAKDKDTGEVQRYVSLDETCTEGTKYVITQVDETDETYKINILFEPGKKAKPIEDKVDDGIFIIPCCTCYPKFNYIGNLASEQELPEDHIAIGDYYTITNTIYSFVWDGSAWRRYETNEIGIKWWKYFYGTENPESSEYNSDERNIIYDILSDNLISDAAIIYGCDETVIPDEEEEPQPEYDNKFQVVNGFLLFTEEDGTKHYFRLEEIFFGRFYNTSNESYISFNYVAPETLEGMEYNIEEKGLLYTYEHKTYIPNTLLSTEEDKLKINCPILEPEISGTYNGLDIVNIDGDITVNNVLINENVSFVPSGDIFELYSDYPQTIVKELVYNNIFEIDENKIYGFDESSFDDYLGTLSKIGTSDTRKSAFVPAPAMLKLNFNVELNEAYNEDNTTFTVRGDLPNNLILKDCNCNEIGEPVSFNAMLIENELVSLNDEQIDPYRTTQVKVTVEKTSNGLQNLVKTYNPAPSGDIKDQLQVIDGTATRFNKFNQLYTPIVEDKTVLSDWDGLLLNFKSSDDNSIKQGLLETTSGYSLYIQDHRLYLRDPNNKTYNTGYIIDNNKEFNIGLFNLYTEEDYYYREEPDKEEEEKTDEIIIDDDGNIIIGDNIESTNNTENTSETTETENNEEQNGENTEGTDNTDNTDSMDNTENIENTEETNEENTSVNEVVNTERLSKPISQKLLNPPKEDAFINEVTNKITDICYDVKGETKEDEDGNSYYEINLKINPAIWGGDEVPPSATDEEAEQAAIDGDFDEPEIIWRKSNLTKCRLYIFDEVLEEWVDLVEECEDIKIQNDTQLYIGYSKTNTSKLPFNGSLDLINSCYYSNAEGDPVFETIHSTPLYSLSQTTIISQRSNDEDNWHEVKRVNTNHLVTEISIGQNFTGYIDCYESGLLKSNTLTWLEKRVPIKEQIINELSIADSNFNPESHDSPFDITAYGVRIKDEFIPQRWDKIRLTYTTEDRGTYIEEDTTLYLDFICEEDENSGKFIVEKVGSPIWNNGISSGFNFTETKKDYLTYNLKDSDEYMVLYVKGTNGVIIGHDTPNKECLFIYRNTLKAYDINGNTYNLNIDTSEGVYVRVSNSTEYIKYSFDGINWFNSNTVFDLNSYSDSQITIGGGYLGTQPISLEGEIDLAESYVKNIDKYYLFKRYTRITPVISLDNETYNQILPLPMLSVKDFVTFGEDFKGSLDLYRSNLVIDGTDKWKTNKISVLEDGVVIDEVYRYPTTELKNALLGKGTNLTLINDGFESVEVKLSDFDIDIEGKPCKGDKIVLNFTERYFLNMVEADYNLIVKYENNRANIYLERASDFTYSNNDSILLYSMDYDNVILNIGYEFKGSVDLSKSYKGEMVLCDYLGWTVYDLISREYDNELFEFKEDIVITSFILKHDWNGYMSLGYDYKGTMDLLNSRVRNNNINSAFADYFNNDYILPVGLNLNIDKQGIASNFSGNDYIKLREKAFEKKNKIFISLRTKESNINQGVCSGIIIRNNKFVEANDLNHTLLNYVNNRNYHLTYIIDKNGRISYTCTPYFDIDYIPKKLPVRNLTIIPVVKEHTGRYIDTGSSLMEILSAPKYFTNDNIVIEYRIKDKGNWITADIQLLTDIDYFGEQISDVYGTEISLGFIEDEFGNEISINSELSMYVGDILEYRVGVVDEDDNIQHLQTNYVELYRDKIIKQEVLPLAKVI